MAIIRKSTRVLVLQRDGSRCKFCGATARQVQLHVDHIKPRDDGGTDKLDNLATLCADCNLGKSNMYFGNYMDLVQAGNIMTPQYRSALRPPKDYQLNALNQIVDRLKNLGIREISLLEFANVIRTSTRDGWNELFEPLSFATVTEGFNELIDKEVLKRTQEGKLLIP